MGTRWNFASWVWISLGCVALITAVTGWAWWATNGETPYPLDDTFIHLAIARNLASGHWGIHPGEVANASSSPLYTALIAVLGIAGVPWLWIPLAINVLSAILLLGAAAEILSHFTVPIHTARFALGGLVVLLPLPYIAMFGMEHTLHSAIALLFVSAAIQTLNGGRIGFLLMLGPLMMGIRLESAFIIGITGLSLLALRRFQDALFLGIASSLPIVVIGILNVSLGEHFLPNSILLKAGISSGGSVWMLPFAVLQKSVLQAFAAPHFIAILVVLIAVADVALKQTRDWRNPRVLWPMASALAIIGHLCFANIGWLYRYEVYLVALSVVGFAISAPRPRRWMLMIFVIPLAFRTWQCASVLPSAILHINAQQVQMAHFVQQNFDTEALAAKLLLVPAYTSAFPISRRRWPQLSPEPHCLHRQRVSSWKEMHPSKMPVAQQGSDSPLPSTSCDLS